MILIEKTVGVPLGRIMVGGWVRKMLVRVVTTVPFNTLRPARNVLRMCNKFRSFER